MKHICTVSISIFILCIQSLAAQMQVSKEPRHRLVIENEYIRLLDVRIEPGDTTEFHKHSTPSVFCYYSNTSLRTQLKGKKWESNRTEAGKAWYESYDPKPKVHRVTNIDTAALHVVVVEMLKAYDTDQAIPDVAMDLPILLENEKVFVYSVTSASQLSKTMRGRGPIIAELISGSSIEFLNELTGQRDEIQAGQFKYIEPNSFFKFTTKGKGQIQMVLVELK
jgi:quercetin dioxygenase-like cupin family protein